MLHLCDLEKLRMAGLWWSWGKTALHAAVISFLDTESTKELLQWKPDLIKETDAYGWTPLHYAARYDNQSGVKCLLENDKSVMYITTDDEDEKTALHIAAATGRVDIMEELLSHCPDCWEMVDGKGQNVVHIAVDMERGRVIEYLLEKSWIIHLINQKDIEGNTPLHLLPANFWFKMPKFWSKLGWHPSGDGQAMNNENMTPFDLRSSARDSICLMRPYGFERIIVSMDKYYLTKWKNYRREQEKVLEQRKKTQVEESRKRADTHLIVATLIATVTFAAGFTMPGGYEGNQGPEQGMPVLLKALAFKVFVITNTIAVICSISSGFLYASASFYDEEDKQDHRYVAAAFWLILIAMGAMVVAFITGTFAVLSHSLGIAIVACLIGCFSFLILIPEVKKLYDDYYIRADWLFEPSEN